MLQIKCDHCGQTLKGKEVKVEPFYDYIEGIKYQDYAVTCTKCGRVIVWDRYTQKATENKEKAIAKLARKTKKTVNQITEAEKYNAIMRKVGKRAKEMASCRVDTRPLQIDINAAVNELPQDERIIVFAYEEKQDMALLQAPNHKNEKAKSNSILLLTQAVIESAIAENDEDFFKSEYGVQIVDTYNTVLTMHKHHDYGITAALLLEKMRKNELVKGECDDE